MNKIYNLKSIMIELTDFCNLRCPMCDHKKGQTIHGHNKQFLKFNVFKRIIDSANRDFNNVDSITLFWQGEALLHPDFLQCFDYLESNAGYNFPIKSYLIHTNAILLSQEIMNSILNSQIANSVIHFSLDASNAKIYSKIRRNGNFNVAVDNIKNFLCKKKKMNKYYPKVNIQFIVMKENYSDILNFYNFWREFLENEKISYSISSDLVSGKSDVNLYFRKLGTGPVQNFQAEKMYTDALHELEHLSNSNLFSSLDCSTPNLSPSKICQLAWYSPVISSDGSVTVCCLDMELDYCLGNVKKSSLFDLWNSKKANKLRKTILNSDWDGLKAEKFKKLCEFCKNH